MKLAESTLYAIIAVSVSVASISVVCLTLPRSESVARATRASHYSELDPPLGRDCSHVLSDSDRAAVPVLYGPMPPPRQETLLILAGACSGCSLHAISPTDQRLFEFREVVFVYEASRTQIENSIKSCYPHVRLIGDLEGRGRKSMNASWIPRFALLSKIGSLKKLQRKPGTLEEFLNEP